MNAIFLMSQSLAAVADFALEEGHAEQARRDIPLSRMGDPVEDTG